MQFFANLINNAEPLAGFLYRSQQVIGAMARYSVTSANPAYSCLLRQWIGANYVANNVAGSGDMEWNARIISVDLPHGGR